MNRRYPSGRLLTVKLPTTGRIVGTYRVSLDFDEQAMVKRYCDETTHRANSFGFLNFLLWRGYLKIELSTDEAGEEVKLWPITDT